MRQPGEEGNLGSFESNSVYCFFISAREVLLQDLERENQNCEGGLMGMVREET